MGGYEFHGRGQSTMGHIAETSAHVICRLRIGMRVDALSQTETSSAHSSVKGYRDPEWSGMFEG
jgi:hypothetical protein